MLESTLLTHYREQCDKPEFSSVEKCEESELGAQAWQVMIGLYHIQGFLLSLRDLIMHQGSLIADQAGEYLNRLNPVNFDVSLTKIDLFYFLSSPLDSAVVSNGTDFSSFLDRQRWMVHLYLLDSGGCGIFAEEVPGHANSSQFCKCCIWPCHGLNHSDWE